MNKLKNNLSLLGKNCAGKTTLIKMLIGEINSTKGKVFIDGFDLYHNFASARQSLGYCPQFDYLPEYLTVQQCFELFADLRGLTVETIPNVLDDLIKVFTLEEHRHKLINNLSGGCKRKISAALAFLGRPKLVILDEVGNFYIEFLMSLFYLYFFK